MAEGLIRLEIIANQTVESEIRTILEECGDSRYTVIPTAYGRGAQEPREGSAIWPEINFIAVVWASKEAIEEIEQNIEKLRLKFLREGIAYFR